MSDRPVVSVVIPAYNHEKFVGAAVESVLGQSWSNLELIVVDDGSTDSTAAVVKSYSDSRLRYYHQENQDAYNTINRGISLAQGEYISILNSDDIYAPERLKRLVEASRQHGFKCLFTDVTPISDAGEEFTDPAFGWNIWHQKNRAFYFASGDLYTAFLKGNFMVTTSNLFMAREVAETVGKFCSLRYLHDYDYMFRILLAFPGQVHYLDAERLLSYRIHSGNTLGEAAVIGRRQDQQLIKKYLAARVPADYRTLVEAAGDRLIELGDELHEVQCQLRPGIQTGVKGAAKLLTESMQTWVKKKVRGAR